jgi:hypothetical protein
MLPNSLVGPLLISWGHVWRRKLFKNENIVVAWIFYNHLFMSLKLFVVTLLIFRRWEMKRQNQVTSQINTLLYWQLGHQLYYFQKCWFFYKNQIKNFFGRKYWIFKCIFFFEMKISKLIIIRETCVKDAKD